MDLMDVIKEQLTPEVLEQISQNTGASEEQVNVASHGAITSILAALNNQAQDPQGAEQLHAQLDEHDGNVLNNVMGLFGGGGQQPQQQSGGGGIGDVLGSVLGGGGLGSVLGNVFGGGGQQQPQQQQSGGGLGDILGSVLGGGQQGGGNILGNIFGGNLGNIVSTISHSSGMNTNSVMQLLMQFAPLILGILGQQKSQNNLSPAGLSNVLGTTVGNMQGNPLMGVISQVLGGGGSQQGGGLMDNLMKNVGGNVLGNLFGRN